MLFGRKPALTFVKTNKTDSTDPAAEPMPLQQVGETIVETAEGVGAVIVVVATTMTVLRITETVVKHIFR
jgi:hypothetical protein